MSRRLLCVVVLPLLVIGCRYVPEGETFVPLNTAVAVVKSPSVVDYPLAAASERRRRANELGAQLVELRANVAELRFQEEAVRERLTYLRSHAVLLPVVREAHSYFYRGKLGAVRAAILTTRQLGSDLARGRGYELNRARLYDERAGVMLKGYIPDATH